MNKLNILWGIGKHYYIIILYRSVLIINYCVVKTIFSTALLQHKFSNTILYIIHNPFIKQTVILRLTQQYNIVYYY